MDDRAPPEPRQAGQALRRRTAAAWRWPDAGDLHGWYNSLAARLLLPVVVLWMFMAAIVAWVIISPISDAVNEAFDHQMSDAASALAAQIRWGPAGAELTLLPQTAAVLLERRQSHARFAVVNNEGRLIAGYSAVLRPSDLAASLRAPQIYDTRLEGMPARAVALTVASPDLTSTVTVLIAESLQRREDVAWAAIWRVGVPALLFGGLSTVLLAIGIRRGLAPVSSLAQDLYDRSANDLRPLPLERIPSEIQPMVQRFNALMEQVRQTMEGQRRIMADAAHQLRTPVAGIRVLADQLRHAVVTPGSRQLVEALSASAQRMSRLTEQLLALARSESARLEDGVPFDLCAALREALEPLVHEALRTNKDVSLDAPDGPVLMRGHPLLIGEAVSNLVDNALRYGGPRIRIGVGAFDQTVLVTVEDDGRGISGTDRARVFEPFWRGNGAHVTSDTDSREAVSSYRGSGLGLAVARDVVHRHGGQVEVLSRPAVDGTRLVITLPRLTT